MQTVLIMEGQERPIHSFRLERDLIIRHMDMSRYINYIDRKQGGNDEEIRPQTDVRSELMGFLFDIRLESTNHDPYFHSWFIETDQRDGEIWVPSPIEKEGNTLHIQFKDAWLINAGYEYSAMSGNPLLLNLHVMAPYIEKKYS